MALSASDIAAVKYRRGTLWFTLQRARALVLLGRTEEALGELGAFSRSGWKRGCAQLLDADTAFDGLRGDVCDSNASLQSAMRMRFASAEVEALRSQQVIPPDLRWR